MKEFQAVCLAVFLLCIGFGGGWFARSQKAETPRFFTLTHGGTRQYVYRYDAKKDDLIRMETPGSPPRTYPAQ